MRTGAWNTCPVSIAAITITFTFHLQPWLAIAILGPLVASLLSGCTSQKKTRVNKRTSLGFAGMKNSVAVFQP
jgi:hypothetical protein